MRIHDKYLTSEYIKFVFDKQEYEYELTLEDLVDILNNFINSSYDNLLEITTYMVCKLCLDENDENFKRYLLDWFSIQENDRQAYKEQLSKLPSSTLSEILENTDINYIDIKDIFIQYNLLEKELPQSIKDKAKEEFEEKQGNKNDNR